jgi:hypothetical protein
MEEKDIMYVPGTGQPDLIFVDDYADFIIRYYKQMRVHGYEVHA